MHTNAVLIKAYSHANRLDLDSPDTIYRTDPHEGRPRGSWLVAMNVHAEAGKPNEAVAAEQASALKAAKPTRTPRHRFL